jgi:hypothetical protein
LSTYKGVSLRWAHIKAPLFVTDPEIAAQWHPTKNGGSAPVNVFCRIEQNCLVAV